MCTAATNLALDPLYFHDFPDLFFMSFMAAGPEP
jgi:hypothetical protein